MKIISILILAYAFAATVLFAQQDMSSHVLYLVGDAGERDIKAEDISKALQKMIKDETSPVTLVYLGDNAYPKGLPMRGQKHWSDADSALRRQAEWIKDYTQNRIFIPGNHDWQQGGKRGWERINNQEKFLVSLNTKDRKDSIIFLPENGCPGPVEFPLTDNAVLVIIDSQWLLHPWEKPSGEESTCDAKTGAELASLLTDIYLRNENKRVILAAHHPLITYGSHGGVFRLKDHIFPLTNIKPWVYLPLPVVGSIYPLYRKWFGSVQDMAHPFYKYYSSSVQKLLKGYPGSIHVSGHEHALEYIVKDSTYMIVSGSGSKTEFVKQKGYAQYADDVGGFVRILLTKKGEADIQFVQVNDKNPEGEIIKSYSLGPVNRLTTSNDSTAKVFADQYVNVRASEHYQANPWRERMLGENYRKEWYQQLKVPLFNMDSLSVVQKGGGMQTLSLRLADEKGREYALRSVEKFPENAVPEMLRKTFAQDLVQDQISAAHPYGALVVPPMAEAVGIYHTNPRLVYVPDDPRLGIYRKLFANTLALFEERPADDWSDKPFFGNSKDIINTSKVISKLQKNNDSHVDQRFTVRSRLFDMVIGDWDRHDDQWRWATLDMKKKETLYRPIPRDRDQAFFVNEGILPRVWSRRWAIPKLEGFDDEISWPSGLSFNARYFDRTFLTEASKDDWIVEAKYIQAHLTDQVIENAIKSWPEEIYAIHGEEIIRKLKSRRNHLVKYAEFHYEFLAREVDVTGSDKSEIFNVLRQPSGDVTVTVYSTKKSGEQDEKIYDRKFLQKETREIRLYGLGGEDKFNIEGKSSRSISVRVIGGDEKDSIDDNSHVNAIKKKTLFYDLKDGSGINSQGEVRNMTSKDPQVNEYNRKAFVYDRLAPLLYGNFNVDDGLFIGGGLLWQTQGFRKDPFKSRHIFLASIAPRTNSFNLLYRGDFTEVVGKWNLELNGDFKVPNFVNNFFGWGNESVFDPEINEQPGINADDAIDYYRYRFEEIRFEAYLSRKIGSIGQFKIGPAFQRIEIEEQGDEDRFVYDYAETLPYDLFSEFNSFTGVRWQLQFQKFDNPLVTRRGIRWTINGSSMKGLDEGPQDFNSFESQISFYHTFQLPGRLTFALRAGGGINTGDYEFYQAQILDGKTELRGFRKTRFYGDSKFYTNMEVRIKLASLHTYLFPVSFGILGFHDVGRVWYKDENELDPTAPSGKSSTWHKSWGGGLWLTPFNMAVLSAEIGHSVEGNLFYLRLGFLF